MLLSQVQQRIRLARDRLAAIGPTIKCYPVVVFGTRQFRCEEIHALNVDLFGCSEIFAKQSGLSGITASYREFSKLKIEREQLIKVFEKLGDKTKGARRKIRQARLAIARMERKQEVLFHLLENALSEMEFVEPSIELRFHSLDNESIQNLKRHRLIQEVGKTEMSAASIRVIIG